MANGEKVKAGGKKAIKDLEPKDTKAVDVKGGLPAVQAHNTYISSYHIGG